MKPQQQRHTQPNHCQNSLSTKNKCSCHKTTTNQRRNISSISRQKTPPSANLPRTTNPGQHDHQTNSPRTHKTHKVRQDKQGGDLKRGSAQKHIDARIPPMKTQRNYNQPITDVFMYQKEQQNNFTRSSIYTSSTASHCPNACSLGFNKNVRSSHRTPAHIPVSPFTPLQRASFHALILQHQMTNNNSVMRTVYALPERQRNPYPCGSAKHTRRANLNRNIRAHLRHDAQRCKDDGAQLQRMLLAHDTQNAYMETLHRRFYSALNNFYYWNIDRHHLEYEHTLIFRWAKNYHIARSLIIDATDKASNATILQSPK
jgi:hypothetical protein